MKKKPAKKAATKKATPKRTTRPTSRKKTRATSSSYVTITAIPVVFRRVIIFTPLAVLVLGLFFGFTQPSMRQAVEGASIMRGMFVQTTILMPQVPGAVAFNIYYKKTNEPNFTHAVRHISPSTTSYTISYLKKDTSYQYKISAISASGAEFWWSPITTIQNTQSM